MLSAMLQYPGNYLSIRPASVRGVGALLLALGRRLWFLLPLAAVYVATFRLPVLAIIAGGPIWVWLIVFAVVVRSALAVAAYINRASRATAILLSLFVVTFAVLGFGFLGFATMFSG